MIIIICITYNRDLLPPRITNMTNYGNKKHSNLKKSANLITRLFNTVCFSPFSTSWKFMTECCKS